MSTGIQYQPWDIVRLIARTDRYRVYTYEYEPGKERLIFVGENSNTVTDERRDTVESVVTREQ